MEEAVYYGRNARQSSKDLKGGSEGGNDAFRPRSFRYLRQNSPRPHTKPRAAFRRSIRFYYHVISLVIDRN